MNAWRGRWLTRSGADASVSLLARGVRLAAHASRSASWLAQLKPRSLERATDGGRNDEQVTDDAVGRSECHRARCGLRRFFRCCARRRMSRIRSSGVPNFAFGPICVRPGCSSAIRAVHGVGNVLANLSYLRRRLTMLLKLTGGYLQTQRCANLSSFDRRSPADVARSLPFFVGRQRRLTGRADGWRSMRTLRGGK